MRISSLTSRYLLALVLLGIFLIGAFVSDQFLLNQHEIDSTFVNISARQRMLAQRTALAAMQLAHSTDSNERAGFRLNLQQSMELMEQSHEALINGRTGPDKARPPGERLQAIYFAEPVRLDRQVRDYLDRLKTLLAEPVESLQPDNPNLAYVLKTAPHQLLGSLELALQQHEEENHTGLGNLQTNLLLVVSFGILTLLLEGLLIFRPTDRRINQYIKNLNVANRKLEASEHELRNSREFLEKILNAIPLQLYIKSREGKYIFVNNSGLEVLGQPLEQVIGRTNADFLPAALAESFRQSDQIVFERQVFSEERSFTPPDSDTELTTLTTRCCLSGTMWGDVMVAIAVDITERKNMEKVLEQKQAFLTAVLQNMQEGIVACDAKGNLTLFNQASVNFHGSPMEEVSSDKWAEHYDLYLPDGQTRMTKYEVPLYRALGGELVRDAEMVIAPSRGPARTVLSSGRAFWDRQGNKLGAVIAMHDVTERLKAQKEVQQEHDFAQQLMRTMGQGLTVINEAGVFEYVNPAYGRMVGNNPEELIGLTPFDTILPEDHHELTSLLEDGLKGHASTYEIRIRRVNRGELYTMVSSVPRWRDGRVVGIISVITDLSERKQAEEELAQQAFYDLLTGLPNRVLFRSRLEQVLAQVHRPTRPEGAGVAVVFIDLDGFKKVNDTLGHAAGDVLLKLVSQRLSACVRYSDTVARIGGDEFTMILPGISSAENAGKVAQSILEGLKEEFEIEGQKVRIGASIGISVHNQDQQDALTLLRQADEAMYRAKNKGKNNYQFYLPEPGALTLAVG